MVTRESPTIETLQHLAVGQLLTEGMTAPMTWRGTEGSATAPCTRPVLQTRGFAKTTMPAMPADALAARTRDARWRRETQAARGVLPPALMMKTCGMAVYICYIYMYTYMPPSHLLTLLNLLTNSGYGGCSSYAAGGENEGFCADDGACEPCCKTCPSQCGATASRALHVVGSLRLSSSCLPACLSSPPALHRPAAQHPALLPLSLSQTLSPSLALCSPCTLLTACATSERKKKKKTVYLEYPLTVCARSRGDCT